MSKKRSKQDFLSAVKAHGVLKHYDLGGGVDLSQGAGGLGSAGGGTTQGGLIGSLLPQSNFSAQLAPTTQLNYTPVVNQAANQALAGYGQSQANLGAQQGLMNTFLQEGQGAGPNPAQQQFAANTGTNVANQAAMAAGQRGASGNVGLMQRNVAQQGAATQQGAAGQAATLQAQQQLAAQQAAAGQQQAIAQGIAQQTGAANQLYGTSAGANNTQNANLVSNYSQAQGANAATSAQNAQAGQGLVGGLMGGLGSMLSLAGGGEIAKQPAPSPTPAPKPTDDAWNAPNVSQEDSKNLGKAFGYADGGDVGSVAPMAGGAQSFAGQLLSQGNTSGSQAMKSGLKQGMTGAQSAMHNLPIVGSMMPGQSKSGEEMGGDPTQMAGGPSEGDGSGGAGGLGALAMLAAKGGPAKSPVTTSQMASKGVDVPGKAKVKGDSLKNDTVPAMLSPDEIVLPRSVTQAPDAPQRAAQFVQAIHAKSGMKRKGKK